MKMVVKRKLMSEIEDDEAKRAKVEQLEAEKEQLLKEVAVLQEMLKKTMVEKSTQTY